MNYCQCKCGKMKSWSSYGAAKCLLCKECGTTLAGSPTEHKTVAEPHDWLEEDTTTTWKGTVMRKHFRKCCNCGEHEDLLKEKTQ